MFFTISWVPVRTRRLTGRRVGSGVEHPVDQSGDGPHPDRVALPPLPVHMAHRREPPQPAGPVLHDDPSRAERTVVPPVLRRTFLPARLATRTGPRTRRVQRTDPDVPPAPAPTYPLRGPPQQAGLLEQLDVRPPPRHRVRHVHDPPGVLVHRHLG